MKKLLLCGTFTHQTMSPADVLGASTSLPMPTPLLAPSDTAGTMGGHMQADPRFGLAEGAGGEMSGVGAGALAKDLSGATDAEACHIPSDKVEDSLV